MRRFVANIGFGLAIFASPSFAINFRSIFQSKMSVPETLNLYEGSYNALPSWDELKAEIAATQTGKQSLQLDFTRKKVRL